MERRRSKRITVNLKAERISCTGECSVFIENLSEDGIYIITSRSNNYKYLPGTDLDLELELSNGEIINLNCNVKWFYNNSSEDQTNSVGLEVLDPPLQYKEFIKNLH